MVDLAGNDLPGAIAKLTYVHSLAANVQAVEP